MIQLTKHSISFNLQFFIGPSLEFETFILTISQCLLKRIQRGVQKLDEADTIQQNENSDRNVVRTQLLFTC